MSATVAVLDVLQASPQSDASTVFKKARVLRKASHLAVTIAIDGRERTARAAASCLLAPENGDLALIAEDDAECYVLAILERPGPAPAVLSAAVPSGEARFEAARLAFSASEEITISAPRTTLRAALLAVTVGSLALAARLVTQAFESWRTSARQIEIVADEIAVKAERRTSLVAETDVLKAGAVVQTIETVAVTSAQSAVVAAKEDLRLDGERVTVG